MRKLKIVTRMIQWLLLKINLLEEEEWAAEVEENVEEEAEEADLQVEVVA